MERNRYTPEKRNPSDIADSIIEASEYAKPAVTNRLFREKWEKLGRNLEEIESDRRWERNKERSYGQGEEEKPIIEKAAEAVYLYLGKQGAIFDESIDSLNLTTYSDASSKYDDYANATDLILGFSVQGNEPGKVVNYPISIDATVGQHFSVAKKFEKTDSYGQGLLCSRIKYLMHTGRSGKKTANTAPLAPHYVLGTTASKMWDIVGGFVTERGQISYDDYESEDFKQFRAKTLIEIQKQSSLGLAQSKLTQAEMEDRREKLIAAGHTEGLEELEEGIKLVKRVKRTHFLAAMSSQESLYNLFGISRNDPDGKKKMEGIVNEIIDKESNSANPNQDVVFYQIIRETEKRRKHLIVKQLAKQSMKTPKLTKAPISLESL